MNRFSFVGSLTLANAVAAIASAHPGHGASESSTLTHYLTEPVHLGWGLPLGLILGVLVWRRLSAIPARHRTQDLTASDRDV